MKTQAELFYDQYITALVFLRRCFMKYNDPISYNYLMQNVRDKKVVAKLLKEGLINVYPDMYWDGERRGYVPGVEISLAGLFKVYLAVPPRYS